MAEPYDVLFSMPWAGPMLAGTGVSGGAETQIVALARGLAGLGLRVGIVVVGRRSSLPREVDGVDVVTQPRPPRIRGLAGLVHDAATLLTLLRTPARVIVTRNAGRVTAVAALAARLRRTRFVYSSANVVDFDLRQLEHGLNVRLFAVGIRAADEVVVQTDEQAELCRRVFGRDARVIRSIAERAERRRATPDAFLWIGRLVSYKRLDVYLDLASDVPEAQFRLIAVPSGEHHPELEAQMSRAGEASPNVEVLEPRPRAQLAPLIERAVAIVGTADYEGMPNAFLEGWARGVPALVFSHDPDGVVERHGLGAHARGSRDKLAELARALWRDRADQRELGDRCVAYVRREHDLEAVGDAWRDLLVALGVRRYTRPR